MRFFLNINKDIFSIFYVEDSRMENIGIRRDRNMFNKITIGPINIYMYGLMIALGFAMALLLCSYR